MSAVIPDALRVEIEARKNAYVEGLEKEITSLHAQLAEAEQELEKANNEFGAQTAHWPDLWRRIAELKEYQRKAEARAADLAAENAQLRTTLAEVVKIAENFNDAQHIASDMAAGIFPNRSPMGVAIARTLRRALAGEKP